MVRRHPSSPGQLEVSRTRTDRRTRPSQTSAPLRFYGRHSTKFACDGQTFTGILESSPTIRSRSATIERHTVFHLRGKLQCQPPGSLFQGIQMVRQRHALQYLYDLGGADQVAEAESRHRPRLRIRADDYERHILADQLEGGPRSELAISLVDHGKAR